MAWSNCNKAPRDNTAQRMLSFCTISVTHWKPAQQLLPPPHLAIAVLYISPCNGAIVTRHHRIIQLSEWFRSVLQSVTHWKPAQQLLPHPILPLQSCTSLQFRAAIWLIELPPLPPTDGNGNPKSECGTVPMSQQLSKLAQEEDIVLQGVQAGAPAAPTYCSSKRFRCAGSTSPSSRSASRRRAACCSSSRGPRPRTCAGRSTRRPTGESRRGSRGPCPAQQAPTQPW